jgi:ribosome-associated toxin RatA of RatAB toxin-antitoxin module
MPTVTLDAVVPDADPDDVFARLCAFEQYADHTDFVRDVRVTTGSDGTLYSEWSVNFRAGVLCWRERDQIDAAARRIMFEQLDGDFHEFGGSWQVAAVGTDATVRFAATFDLGMPSVAAIIDPIAERALRDVMTAVIRGLLGERVTLFDISSSAVTAP